MLTPPALVYVHLGDDIGHGLYDERKSSTAQLSLYTVEKQHEELADPAEPACPRSKHQSNRARSCTGERSRRAVRSPSQLGGNSQDSPSGCLRKAGATVQGVRDRALGYVRSPGDIDYRRSAFQPRPLIRARAREPGVGQWRLPDLRIAVIQGVRVREVRTLHRPAVYGHGSKPNPDRALCVGTFRRGWSRLRARARPRCGRARQSKAAGLAPSIRPHMSGLDFVPGHPTGSSRPPAQSRRPLRR